jgi:hypothetical protein
MLGYSRSHELQEGHMLGYSPHLCSQHIYVKGQNLRCGFLSCWISLRNIGNDLRKTQVEYVSTKFSEIWKKILEFKNETKVVNFENEYRLKTSLFSSAHLYPSMGGENMLSEQVILLLT